MVNIQKSGFKLHGKVAFFQNDAIYQPVATVGIGFNSLKYNT